MEEGAHESKKGLGSLNAALKLSSQVNSSPTCYPHKCGDWVSSCSCSKLSCGSPAHTEQKLQSSWPQPARLPLPFCYLPLYFLYSHLTGLPDVLQCTEIIPASGPLHLLFPLPGKLCLWMSIFHFNHFLLNCFCLIDTCSDLFKNITFVMLYALALISLAPYFLKQHNFIKNVYILSSPH